MGFSTKAIPRHHSHKGWRATEIRKVPIATAQGWVTLYRARNTNNQTHKYSDISIEVNRIMNGHSIVALELSISSKNEVELVFLKEEIDKELGSPQVSIWELAGEKIREEKI